jgi:hypothetical protein
LIRVELTPKTPNGGQLVSVLLDCVATLDFLSEDFVRHCTLQTRKSQTKTKVRLANGQRVTSSTFCDITFELARQEFQLTFYVLRDLRAADPVLGLPWLDDEHASLQIGTTRVFNILDETLVDTQIEERRPQCLSMSSNEIHKLMRKTRRSRGRNVLLYVIDISPATE